jgi:hypothetical protein
LVLFFSGQFVQPAGIAAGGYSIDQQNTSVSSSSAALRIYGRDLGQSFKPEQNRIGQIDIFIRYPVAGSWIAVEVVRTDTGATVTTGGNRMISSEGWQSMPVGEAELDPDTSYTMYVTVDGNYNTMWVRSNANPYSRGHSFIDGSADTSDDFGFKTWGYTQEEFEFEPIPLATPTPTPVAEESGEVDDNPAESDTPGSSESQDDPAVESGEIYAPELEYVQTENEKFDDPEEFQSIELDQNLDKSMKLVGIAEPNSEVVITVGTKQYTIQANESGQWSLEIDLADFKGEGSFGVEAQAIKDDKKSNVVKLMSVSLVGVLDNAEKGEEYPESFSNEGGLSIVSVLVLLFFVCLLVVGVVIATIVIYKRRKKSKAVAKAESKEKSKSTTKNQSKEKVGEAKKLD